MEGRVESNHLRHRWKNLLASPDSEQVGRIVERAKSQQKSILLMTSSSTMALPEKKSAPCTILWPTASMSSKDFSTPYSLSIRASSTICIPTV